MRLSSFAGRDTRLGELVPTGVTAPAGTTPAPVAGATTMAPGQPVAQDPQAQQKMAAQQALDRQNRKKQIQDQIKQTQDQLQDLQKQLAAIK
jgi:hypothetical protein